MTNNMIQFSDGFIWLDVTSKAKKVFLSGLFELHIIYSDYENESLILTLEQLEEALLLELKIGIEVGIAWG